MQQKDISNTANEKISPSLFARNLKLLRKIKGISQQKLAEVLELKRNNIASYESGIVEPTHERFMAISRYFDIDPVELLTTDLSQHAAEHIEVKIPAIAEDIQTYHEFEAFINQTVDLEKVVEGFKEFYQFKKKAYPADNYELQSLSNDFENLLGILENLLNTNWDFIHSNLPQE